MELGSKPVSPFFSLGVSEATLYILFSPQEKPYVMEKEDKDNRTGNDRYEGFCVDLMERIALKAGFNYTLVLVHDNQYGVPLDAVEGISGRAWTGMIGEVLSKVCSLSISTTDS